MLDHGIEGNIEGENGSVHANVNHTAFHVRVSRQSIVKFCVRREIRMISQYSDYTRLFYVRVD
jgi:hypothetical protein